MLSMIALQISSLLSGVYTSHLRKFNQFLTTDKPITSKT